MFAILYYLATLRNVAHGAPISLIELEISDAAGNLTMLNTRIAPAWASTSGVRGTSAILYSCTLTLVVCVYTALHLNVAPPDKGRWQFFWRKLKWVAAALFAPEIVLYCACAQFREARILIKELNAIQAGNRFDLKYG